MEEIKIPIIDEATRKYIEMINGIYITKEELGWNFKRQTWNIKFK